VRQGLALLRQAMARWGAMSGSGPSSLPVCGIQRRPEAARAQLAGALQAEGVRKSWCCRHAAAWEVPLIATAA